jgi:hypothetical protein
MTATAPINDERFHPISWRAPEPLTRDRCEVCGLLLFESERVEVQHFFKVADDDPMMGGLALITATYCTAHAPKEPTP